MSAWNDELNELCQKNGGVLRACDVVEYARDPATALHAQFEWDNSAAAEAYRLTQARRLIRVSVTVTQLQKQAICVRTYSSLVEDRKETGGGYRYTLSVLSDDEQRKRLLQQAQLEAIRWRKRYQSLAELAPIFAAIDQSIEQAQFEMTAG